LNQPQRDASIRGVERHESEWSQQIPEQPQQGSWTYIDALQNNPGKTGWRHILHLLAISICLGAAALALSAIDDSMTAHSLLLLFTGLLCGIGATCYGVAFWGRMFQRCWWKAIVWFTLMLLVNGSLYVAAQN